MPDVSYRIYTVWRCKRPIGPLHAAVALLPDIAMHMTAVLEQFPC